MSMSICVCTPKQKDSGRISAKCAAHHGHNTVRDRKSGKRDDHMVFKAPNIIACLHCGQSYGMNLPAPVELVSAMSAAFIKSHRTCKKSDKGTACSHCFTFGHATAECPSTKYRGNWGSWLNGPDTGASSITICWVLSGNAFVRPSVIQGNYPYDPDDFGRCHRLLHAIPGWRPRIIEVGVLSAEWKALAENWDELERLYLEELPTGECPKLYARMRALTER